MCPDLRFASETLLEFSDYSNILWHYEVALRYLCSGSDEALKE